MKADATIFALRALILAALLAVAWLMCGCCNLMRRTEKPYFVAPGPYNCTAEVGDMLAAHVPRVARDLEKRKA